MFDLWFWLWSVLAVVLLVGEIFTAGFFLLPFGIGAIAAAGLAFFAVSVLWQTIAFIAVSAIAFLLLRRFADRMTHEPPVKTAGNRLIGEQGMVTEELTPDSRIGLIRIKNEEWRADAPGHGIVPVGTQVLVDRVDGTHLIVHPVTTTD